MEKMGALQTHHASVRLSPRFLVFAWSNVESAIDRGQSQWYIYPRNHTYSTYPSLVYCDFSQAARAAPVRLQGRRLPLNDLREELLNEALVVRLELLRVHRVVALAVQVIRVERLYGRERLLVLGVAEVLVSALAVPAWCAV